MPSAPRHHAFVFKPFAFTPGAFGTTGIFGGEGISSDLAKKAADNKARSRREEKEMRAGLSDTERAVLKLQVVSPDLAGSRLISPDLLLPP